MKHSRSILLLAILLAASFNTSAQKAPEEAVSRGYPNGNLIVIGGGRVGPEITEEFIRLAGGKEARIVLIPTALDDKFMEKQAFSTEKNPFSSFNVDRITILHTRDTAEANSAEFIEVLKTATGIFFTGGRQWRIADGFLNTRAHEEMFSLLDRGGVIAGTSAGATIQGSYLARGDTKNNQIMMGDHEEGLGFISNVAIDQHVLARNRQFDMFDILREKPELLGIGIDEGTAIHVKGDTFEVIGESYVLIYDGGFWSREGSDLKNLPHEGAQFYFLRPGDRYNMAKRKVIRK